MEEAINNLKQEVGETEEQQKNRQREEEDEEMGGCKEELERLMDRGGGREEYLE